MKYLQLLIVFLLCYSCKNPQANKTVELGIERNVLNDSVLDLISEFNKSNDTMLVEKALLLSDKMISIDKNKDYEIQNLNLRGQILYYLGRYKENFELTGLLLSKNGSNIDRMIHKAVDFKMKNQNDSVRYCLDSTLEECNSIITDSLDIPTVFKIAEIHVIMGKKSEIGKIVKELLNKYPEKSEELNIIFEEADEIEKKLSLLLKK